MSIQYMDSLNVACSPVFRNLLHAIDNGDSKNPLLFLRGIYYHDISAILDFMYSGQTKIPPNRLDAFLAAAGELKVRGLSQENERNEYNPIDSNPSRKNPAQDKQDTFENKDGLMSKSKKTKASLHQQHEENNVCLK